MALGLFMLRFRRMKLKSDPLFIPASHCPSQKNYPAHRLEFLALKRSVCDKFSHWLKGHQFTVWTDNNALTHILTKPKLDCSKQHWVAKLVSYDIDIKYVPGQQNVVANALSRVPFVKESVIVKLRMEPCANFLSRAMDFLHAFVQNAFLSSTDHKQLAPMNEDTMSVKMC